ncbi:hypothetical protein DFS34DRAFT_638982 [Phlyctochytrium arcticum]|nr:hypothetical protein DFS34DRAFT_638982 [Phlyctochytrium arcticum]
MSLADDLRRYKIEAIQATSLRFHDTPGALRAIEAVRRYTREVEGAVRRALAPPPESTDHVGFGASRNGLEGSTSPRLPPRTPSGSGTDRHEQPAPDTTPAFDVTAYTTLDPRNAVPDVGTAGSSSTNDDLVCFEEVLADPADDMAINLRIGDRVRIDIRMEDGQTGIGVNLNTGAMGSFPLRCVRKAIVESRPPPVTDSVPVRGPPRGAAADWPDRRDSRAFTGAEVAVPHPVTPVFRGYADAHLPPHLSAPNLVLPPQQERPNPVAPSTSTGSTTTSAGETPSQDSYSHERTSTSDSSAVPHAPSRNGSHSSRDSEPGTQNSAPPPSPPVRENGSTGRIDALRQRLEALYEHPVTPEDLYRPDGTTASRREELTQLGSVQEHHLQRMNQGRMHHLTPGAPGSPLNHMEQQQHAIGQPLGYMGGPPGPGSIPFPVPQLYASPHPHPQYPPHPRPMIPPHPHSFVPPHAQQTHHPLHLRPLPPPLVSPRPLSAQVLQKRKFARAVIEELYETEKNFMDGMEVLINQFMYPMAHASSSSDGTFVITKVEHSILFRNIPGLRKLSRKICGLLKAAMTREETDAGTGAAGSVSGALTGGGAVAAVVDVFLVNVEFEEWGTYVRYMEGYLSAKQTLGKLKNREAFVDFLAKCESAKECNRYTFDHYMILPVQRIGRYHLLLGRLKTITDPEDPLHQMIQTAEQYMKQIGDVLESVQKQEEELRKVFDLFQKMEGCPPDIISASRRRLIISCNVEELYSARKLVMHVFSDSFLLCSTKPQPLTYQSSTAGSSSWRSHKKDRDRAKRKEKEDAPDRKGFVFVARVELANIEVQSVGTIEEGLTEFPHLSELMLSQPCGLDTNDTTSRVLVLRDASATARSSTSFSSRSSMDKPLPRHPSNASHNLTPTSPSSPNGGSSNPLSRRPSVDSTHSTPTPTTGMAPHRRSSSHSAASAYFGRQSTDDPNFDVSLMSTSFTDSPSSSLSLGKEQQSQQQDLYAFKLPDATQMAGLLAALGMDGGQQGS